MNFIVSWRIILIATVTIALLLSTKRTLSLKHHLVLTDDPRIFATVSSFGYLRDGRLEVVVQNLTLIPDPSEDNNPYSEFGFVLTKSPHTMTNPFSIDPDVQVNSRHLPCLANSYEKHQDFLYSRHYSIITMGLYPDNSTVLVKCTGDSKMPTIYSMASYTSKHSHSGGSHTRDAYQHHYTKRAAGVNNSNAVVIPIVDKRTSSSSSSSRSSINELVNDASNHGDYSGPPERRFRDESNQCGYSLPLIVRTLGNTRKSYEFNFTMKIAEPNQEGFYYLMFHNCRGQRANSLDERYTPSIFSLDMLIDEINYPENFLSAGSMPLPQMYFVLSILFLLIGCIWINFITSQIESTLRIHHLMTVLVFAKSCSLLFHGINYHYIAMYGQPVVTWAYLYYATRSIKGALFFITLALIGSGWSFIKHILSDKDKKFILFVVCLQVIAHVAEIVLDESTEGQISYEVSAQICSLVDLISCLAILYPISLSVRHLEEASRTDGKAAINLRKLELFKRFYIISTIYIYITRIVTFIFLSILSYKYSWLADLVSEFATLIYFITTGYYFQPIPTNPYLLLSSENDLEEDILFSLDGAHDIEGATRLNDINDSEIHDRNTLLDEGKQKMTRRVIDDIV